MRSLHELLTLLHKRVAGYPLQRGLCYEVNYMQYFMGIYTVKEYLYLRSYIERNAPHTKYYSYWYPLGEKTRRLEWIEHHLQINKKR